MENNKKIAVGLISLGCPKNLVDSEVLVAYLDHQRFHICEHIEDAEIAVINTCCFIKEAYDETLETISYIARLKKQGQCQGLIVCGCIVERMGSELFEHVPEIDALIGTKNQDEITIAIDRCLSGKRYVSGKKKQVIWDPDVLVKLTPAHFAYVKISEGCRNFCTFCVIPKLRGEFKSRPFESVLREVKELARAGIKEIDIIGQDTTSYGCDLYGELKVADLLREISTISGINWIRLLYTYPEYITDTLLDTIASHKKLCNYLDIPLQHISQTVLKRMGRRMSSDKLKELVKKVRLKIPGVGIRTTFIVGFPGETQKDFEELLSFIDETKFERLGIFAYSSEKGTPAYTLPDQVPENVKQERLEEAMLLQQDISREANKTYIDSVVEVMIDGASEEDDGVKIGRTEHDAPEVDGMVYVYGVPDTSKPGDILQVKITDCKEYDLIGTALLTDKN